MVDRCAEQSRPSGQPANPGAEKDHSRLESHEVD